MTLEEVLNMTIEDKLKDLILSKYRSIREFTQVIDMPYSTFDTILKRGIDNSSVTNVIKICKELSISADALAAGKIVPAAVMVQPREDASDIEELLSELKSKIVTYDNLTIRGIPLEPIDRLTIANAIDIAIEIGLRVSGNNDRLELYKSISSDFYNKNHNKNDK